MIYSYPLFAVAILTRFVRLKAPQDYFGGVVLMAIALFALWASSDLQGMRGFSFGAGTAPRMFGVLLLLLGVAIAVIGLFTEGPHLAKYAWRGPLFVSLAILALCAQHPAAGSDHLGIRELHDCSARHGGNQVEGNHHRRRLPDGFLQLVVSLCARSAVADEAMVYDPVRA